MFLLSKKLNFAIAIGVCAVSINVAASPQQGEQFTGEHKQWLKEQFAQKHQALLPKVAVADMFYACNQARKTDQAIVSLDTLITKVDKNMLAEKLSLCLGDDAVNSDVALNFGLEGCFSDQLSQLDTDDRKNKMTLVKNAITRLSREERQKSFTKCVSEQAIKYIK